MYSRIRDLEMEMPCFQQQRVHSKTEILSRGDMRLVFYFEIFFLGETQRRSNVYSNFNKELPSGRYSGAIRNHRIILFERSFAKGSGEVAPEKIKNLGKKIKNFGPKIVLQEIF